MLLWKRSELTKHRQVLGIGTTYYESVHWVMYADGELAIYTDATSNKQIGEPNDWNDTWNDTVTKVSIRGRIAGQGNGTHNCKNWLATFKNVEELHTSIYFGRSITTNSGGIGTFSKWYYEGSLDDWCTSRDNRHQNASIATKAYDLYLNGTLLSGNVVLSKSGSSGVLAYVKNIDSVTFEDGVTSFSGLSFYNLTTNSVTIPESITVLPDNAFNTANVTNIIMPSGITRIGTNSFVSAKLTLIDFSKSLAVPTYTTNAFRYASGDYTILVPSSLYDEWVVQWEQVATHIVAA